MAKQFTLLNLDRPRPFRFGTKAASLLEDKLNKKLKEIDFKNLSIKEMATVFWVGLVHDDKELTPDKVLDILDEFDNDELNEIMLKAFPEGDNPKEIPQP